jgi:hypothetical protein
MRAVAVAATVEDKVGAPGISKCFMFSLLGHRSMQCKSGQTVDVRSHVHYHVQLYCFMLLFVLDIDH